MAAALPALPFAAAGGGPVGLFVLLASLLVGTFVMLPKRRRSGGIGQLPGPKQHPLLGNFLDLATPRSHQVVEEWGRRFGALARFKLLHDSILITDPVVVEDVLGRRGAEELPKPALIYKPLDPIYSPKSIPSFFTTPDASMWAAVRKGCMPAFSADNMRKAFPVVRDAVQEVGDHLEAQAALPAGKQGLDMQEASLRVALDSFALPALQHDFGARHCGECEVLQVLPELLAEFSLRALNPLRAVWQTLAPWTSDAAAFSSNLRKAHALWAQLAAEVRATDLAAADAAGDTSLRACLARLRDPATGQLLTEEQLGPQVAAFLVAGFETTAHSVSWALYELARNEGVQAKLAAELAGAELASAPGRPARQLELADLSSLPYIDQVWREALRLHPVASIGPIRQADRDVTLKNGLRVPKGTMLWTSVAAILTSPNNFTDSQRFWPERWAQPGAVAAADRVQAPTPAAAAAAAADGEGTEAAAGGRCPFGFSGQPTPAGNSADLKRSFPVFSYGPRDCMGQALANMVGKTMLASLVSRFSMRVAPRMGSYEEVRAAEVNRLTMQSGVGVWLLLEPRSS